MGSARLPLEPVSRGGMVGESEALLAVLAQVQRVAPLYRTALLSGETGTGKELLARLLHDSSRVSQGPFVALNCSAVVETLFESELFGHLRGAFTDACRDKAGLFEMANGGTLFLDEIGDMPLPIQAKLLRVLQNQEVLRVGALKPHKVEVHVIAASNKDLRAEVEAKRFREDLYYRISMLEFEMPPLRERQGDVPLLAQFFGRRWAEQFGKPWLGLSAGLLARLESYAWPGNVRELENVIGHASMLAAGEPLGLADLPKYLRDPGRLPAGKPKLLILPLPAIHNSDLLEEQERQLLLQALDQTGQNQARAARVLGTSRDRLRYKMKKHGLLGAPAEAAFQA